MAALVLLAAVAASPVAQLNAVHRHQREAAEMFSYAFDAYISHSFPSDLLRPVTCSPLPRDSEHAPIIGNFSLTLIDALDSLVIFNRTQDFAKLGNYVIENVTFDADLEVSVFEATIRVLGGLLSAHGLQCQYSLIPDYADGFLHLAEALAQRLLPAFSTPTGLPASRVNLRSGWRCPSDVTSTAEATTLSLEFALLADLTGNDTYRSVAEKAVTAVAQHALREGLPGSAVNVTDGNWASNRTTVGPGLDSYYEYLLKASIAHNCTSCYPIFRQVLCTQIYRQIKQRMSYNGWLLDIDRFKGTPESVVVSSLAAFWPSLEVLIGELQSAVETHALFYAVWAHYGGLPDMLNLGEGGLAHFGRDYPLRPEFVESNYYLYQATHNPLLLDIAVKAMEDLNATRTPCGFATVSDVSKPLREYIDVMDSFFLSETLKYLYLTFAEAEEFYYPEAKAGLDFWCFDMCCDVYKTQGKVDLRSYVMTTEGHFAPISRTRFDLNVTVPRQEVATCPVQSQPALNNLIETLFRPIYINHGKGNRTQPISLPAKPVSPPEATPSEGEKAMRLMLLNGVYIAAELTATAAAFGRPFRQNVSASLELARPVEACEELSEVENPQGKVRFMQFLLVKRGACEFAVKAQWAEKAGVDGILVYDHRVVESALITMVMDGDTQVDLYAAFTTFRHGEAFRKSPVLSLVFAPDSPLPAA